MLHPGEEADVDERLDVDGRLDALDALLNDVVSILVSHKVQGAPQELLHDALLLVQCKSLQRDKAQLQT